MQVNWIFRAVRHRRDSSIDDRRRRQDVVKDQAFLILERLLIGIEINEITELVTIARI